MVSQTPLLLPKAKNNNKWLAGDADEKASDYLISRMWAEVSELAGSRVQCEVTQRPERGSHGEPPRPSL